MVLLVGLIALLGAAMVLERTHENWRDWIFTPRVPAPPVAWRQAVRDDDVLDDAKGFRVAYWGRTDATYGVRATAAKKPFEAIVFHYTEDRPALQFIRYQHNGDDRRGGSFGYHFYCDKGGRAYQGAPLSVRTNHIKPTGHRQRKREGRYLSSSNTVGVAMVGGCWRDRHKLKPVTLSCDGERLTEAQKLCGMAVAHALQERFGLALDQVYGHGDLQHDRSTFEGATLTAAMKAETNSGEAVNPAAMMSLGAAN